MLEQGAPPNRPKLSSITEGMHAPSNHEIKLDQLLWLPTVRLTMYNQMPLGLMLQLDPHLPSIQSESEGTYFPKAHNQRG